MMAQRKQLTWSELRVGLLVLVGVFLIAVGIFYVTGAGILAAKYRVRTYLPEVEGLSIGAPVRLDGVEVGNVDKITMNPKPERRERNIEVTLRIDRKFQNEIRTDSSASLITEGLLGNRYVSIERGFTGSPIPNGGEVPGREERAMKQIVERGAELVQNLNTLSDRVNDLIAGVERGRGNLGKLFVDEQAYNRILQVLERAEKVVAEVQAGRGTIGRLVADDELYNRFNSAAARVDSVLADVQSQKGTLGKVVYDPKAYDEFKRFVEQGNAILADARAGKGTAGKLLTDDSLYSSWRATGQNMESATAKLNQNTTTAGKIFSDPQLYDNLAGLTGDMRLLIADFRKNPKKFLHVKFSLF
jgi:phospholipid/cholesterol/gamma-HCH transport system substrate-binding protein